MQLLLEKIVPSKRQRRYYAFSIDQTLFGEWRFIREWGRIGAAGGRKLVEYLASEGKALLAMETVKRAKNKRGYATLPVQLKLFDPN